MEEIQSQLQETKELLMKEREAPKKVVEQVPPAVAEQAPPAVSEQVRPVVAEQVPQAEEVPVIDHELVHKLTAENEKLKVRSCFRYAIIISW